MTETPVLVITGTSRGIGLEMSRYFVLQGYQVVGCSRGEGGLTADNYTHMKVDVTDENQVRSWIRAIKNRYSRIDILVCNAALVPRASLLTATSGRMLDDVFRTNVHGAYLVFREAAKLMMLQRFGRIITISSVAVSLHEEGTSLYSASKSAVVEMTKVLAKEIASFGVTCNVVAPSVFMTSALQNLGETVVAHALDQLTIKRPLSIEEICKAVEFFAATESSCITGQVLYMGLVG